MGDHRLQHLRRRDHRPAKAIAQSNDALLRPWHFLEWQLDAQVPARDHHSIRRANDVLDVLECRVLLYLGDDEHLAGDHRPQLGDVLRATHEAERDVIDPLLRGKRDVFAILLGDRGSGDGDSREVHPLVTAEQSAMEHTGHDARLGDLQHDELDETVVDQHAIADMHVLREILVGDGQLVVARVVLGREHDVAAVGQGDRRWEIPNADPRPLEIAEDRDRAAEVVGDLPNERDRRRVLLVRTVREVDAGDVEPRFHETAQRIGRRGRRPERADDLRAAECQVACWAKAVNYLEATRSRPNALVFLARPAISVSYDFWKLASPSTSSLFVTSSILTPS